MPAKSRFSLNTPDPLCAKDTRHLMRFARNGSIQRSAQRWHRLSLKFRLSLTLGIGYPHLRNRFGPSNALKTLIRHTEFRKHVKPGPE